MKMKKIIIIVSCCSLLLSCNNGEEFSRALVCDESYNLGDTVRVQFVGSENIDYYLTARDIHSSERLFYDVSIPAKTEGQKIAMTDFFAYDLVTNEKKGRWTGKFYDAHNNFDSSQVALSEITIPIPESADSIKYYFSFVATIANSSTVSPGSIVAFLSDSTLQKRQYAEVKWMPDFRWIDEVIKNPIPLINKGTLLIIFAPRFKPKYFGFLVHVNGELSMSFYNRNSFCFSRANTLYTYKFVPIERGAVSAGVYSEDMPLSESGVIELNPYSKILCVQ